MNLTDIQMKNLSRRLYKRVMAELDNPLCLPAWGNLAEKLLSGNTKKKQADVDPELEDFKSALNNLPIGRIK